MAKITWSWNRCTNLEIIHRCLFQDIQTRKAITIFALKTTKTFLADYRRSEGKFAMNGRTKSCEKDISRSKEVFLIICSNFWFHLVKISDVKSLKVYLSLTHWLADWLTHGMSGCQWDRLLCYASKIHQRSTCF